MRVVGLDHEHLFVAKGRLRVPLLAQVDIGQLGPRLPVHHICVEIFIEKTHSFIEIALGDLNADQATLSILREKIQKR